ncbi:MAG: transcription antitermination factor NusB [Ignavibacteriae bacterium]|nr:transcription antitermination factor NusB [Ignavibacteriota bacterium]MCB9215392.1 transcription antitermination factor NusB [Ignavibacteria bacterium]
MPEHHDALSESDWGEEEDQLTVAVNRRDVRMRVMQALYAGDIGEIAGGADMDLLAARLVSAYLEGRADLQEFALSLLRRAWNNRESCDDVITKLAENWDFNRITPIDKAVLRMGIAELLYFPDIPTRVTINEAIEIAKMFSTDKSGVFINGMLDAAVDMLKKADRLQKSGRGLLEE